MDTTIYQESDSASRNLDEIRQQRQEALNHFETHRRLGDTSGAWFHYGMALGFNEALVTLSEDGDSDFPGPDPVKLAMEAPKDERVAYVHALKEAFYDLDLGDYNLNEVYEELELYRENWNKRIAEEGR